MQNSNIKMTMQNLKWGILNPKFEVRNKIKNQISKCKMGKTKHEKCFMFLTRNMYD